MKKILGFCALISMLVFASGMAEAFVAEAMFFSLFQQALERAMAEETAVTKTTATEEEMDADSDVGEIVPINQLWVKFTPTVDLEIDEPNTLVYDVGGRKTTALKAGKAYFLCSKQEYQEFIPANGDELTYLALPGTKVKRVENGGAIITPISSWKKPANSDELKYTVHCNSTQDQPAGKLISSQFTGWVEPAKQVAKTPIPEKEEGVVVAAPVNKGGNEDLWAQLRAEVAGLPAPKLEQKPKEEVKIPDVVEPKVEIPSAPKAEKVSVTPMATVRINELWMEVVFNTDTTVSAGSWIFATNGDQLFPGSMAKAGAKYYMVPDPQRYTNFVPQSWRDFSLLQIPGAKLEREGDFGARYVRPVGPWKKPTGRNFIVHYNNAQDRPAGFIIEGVFTGWVLPK